MPLSSSAPLGSLRNQLLRWLIVPLVVLVALNAVSLYRDALEAADIAYDRSLLASTRALAERVSMRDGQVVADVPYVALDDDVNLDAIELYIHRIRKKLDRRPDGGAAIVTLRGIGYLMQQQPAA